MCVRLLDFYQMYPANTFQICTSQCFPDLTMVSPLMMESTHIPHVKVSDLPRQLTNITMKGQLLSLKHLICCKHPIVSLLIIVYHWTSFITQK